MNSQTSTGISPKNFVFDRESGKTLVIQYPSFDLVMSNDLAMSNYSLSFRTNLERLPFSKLIALLKCLLILQSLPAPALEEAAEELEGIADFYFDRFPQADLPTIPASSIKGKLKPEQVRPPIVLEP